MTRFKNWTDYYYPGSDVLRNLEDIRDGVALRQFEEQAARVRHAELLYADPVEGRFDREHMKAIHGRLFGDVYKWAGKERVGPTSGFMTKGGPSPTSILAGDYAADDKYPHQYFPANEAMLEHFDRYCKMLDRDDLRDIEPDAFVEAIADPWAEINSAHLFREGNTRTQVVFFTYFARHHGHDLDFDRFTVDAKFRLRFNAARFLSKSKADNALLVEVLREVIDVPLGVIAAVSSGEAADDYQPMYSADEYAEKYGDGTTRN